MMAHVGLLACLVACFGAAAAVDVRRATHVAHDQAARGELDGTIRMKVSRLAGEKAGFIAGQLAETMGCGRPKRTFRPAGKHELKHVRAGLDMYFTADCAEDDREDDAGPSPQSSARTKAGARAARAIASVAGARGAELLEHVDSLTAGLAVRRLDFGSYEVDDPLRTSQTHYDAIGLNEAWALGAGDASVVVGVVDTGMDMEHPDLQRNVWRNEGEICGNGVDDDKNGFVDDCYGYNFGDETGTTLYGGDSHGTHCAGTIAADSDNGLYVAGVAGGRDGQAGASLMTLTVFGLSKYAGFAESVVYATDNGARVTSNSWGYMAADAFEQEVLDAIEPYRKDHYWHTPANAAKKEAA